MKGNYRLDLSFWRFLIVIQISKSFTWGKYDDTYLLHVGTFTDGKNTAVKVVVLPVLIMAGWIK
jgi:hypothetical protein